MVLNDTDSLKFVQDKLTRDYNEISPELKYLLDEKYTRIMSATSIEELINITKGTNINISRIIESKKCNTFDNNSMRFYIIQIRLINLSNTTINKSRFSFRKLANKF